MANLRDFTGKNKVFTGTDAETISKGTTAQRVDGQAKIRFNTTTNLMEYYDGTDWKAIDAPPVISGFTVDDVGGSSVTSATIDNEKSADSGLFTIEVLGSLFDTTGAGVQFIATAGNGETINTQSITRNSANKLTVTVTASDFDVANSPYTIRVTNGSGLSANLEACITADTDAPTFTNAADTNFDVYDSARSSGTISAANLIEASNVVSSSSAYAVTTGSLPTGFTLNTTTGDITWSSVSAVGSDTQTLFTITATSTEGGTTARQFGITVKAPTVQSYTSTGTTSFTIPTGVTTMDVLVVAGGGSGGFVPNSGGFHSGGGGGGAGGLIYRPGFPVTPGASVTLTVGSGGTGGRSHNPGSDSVFSTLTAKGGGKGAVGTPSTPNSAAANGGSGGGGNRDQPTAGNATQPGQPGDSGTYGFGNGGGNASDPGGGGGGAGGSGGNSGGSGSAGGNGGAGRTYNISGSPVGYAGGGGGNNGGNSGGSNASSGGGAGLSSRNSSDTAPSGTANRGGGGGAHGAPNAGNGSGNGGNGGSGVVILTY